MRPNARSFLATLPGLKPALGLSTVYSLVGTAGTLLSWTVVARLIAAALLHHLFFPRPAELALMAAGWLTRTAAQALREHHNAWFGARAVRYWRDHSAAAALRLGPVALSAERGSDLSLLGSDLEARLTPYYARYLPQTAHAGVAALGVLAATLLLDPATAVVLIVTGPLAVLFLALVGLVAQAETERQWLAHTRLAARLVGLVRNLPTLHAFGQVAAYRRVLDESAAVHRVTTLKVLRVAFLSGFVMDFAATISTALAAVWIGVRLYEGHAALAPTLAALTLMPEFFGPLRQLGADRHAALDAEPLALRLQTLLGQRSAPSGEAQVGSEQRSSQHSLPLHVPHLRLLRASADLAAPTLPLSADLAPGTHLALLGPSGSGKTALLHALRKHVPHTGQIQADGLPLDSLDAARWQEQVAFVPQGPRLLAASLRENVRLLAQQASDQEVLTALNDVGLGVLGSLPDGLNTLLGEGGLQLSGGETARLALARALLSRAGVVLLDEVTAHLDAKTAAQIERLIGKAFAGRTVILATHRAIPAGFRSVFLGQEEPASGAAA